MNTVFKVTKTGVAPVAPKDITESDEEELATAMQVVGEAPGQGDGKVSTEDVTAVEEGMFTSQGEVTKSVSVQVDGPLGRYFTECLNKVLAKESMMMTAKRRHTSTGNGTSSDGKRIVEAEVPDIWVKAMDEKDFDFEDVIEIDRLMELDQQPEMVIAVESVHITPAVNRMVKNMHARNSRLWLKIDRAVNQTADLIREKLA